MVIINASLTLKDLPPPPRGKSGWPWTEQHDPMPERMPDGSAWPRISIITPSYNQGQFVEETIRSVLLQGYPNLEYIIIDGGSTDGTLEIFYKYEKYLAYWVSEPDKGQANALNKGFHRATGELIGWQNSDDYYHLSALKYAANSSKVFKDADLIYGSINYVDDSKNLSHFMDGDIYFDSNGSLVGAKHISRFDMLEMIPYANIGNQSMFFRSKVFEQGNFIDESFQHAMDYDFFWRLILKGYNFQFVPEVIGYYRLHNDAKGCKPDNLCLVEMLKMYKSIYQNFEIPLEVRAKAWLYIRRACLDHYGKLKLSLFHESIKELIAIRGWAALDSGLVIRYLISLIGATNLKFLRKIKRLVHKK